MKSREEKYPFSQQETSPAEGEISDPELKVVVGQKAEMQDCPQVTLLSLSTQIGKAMLRNSQSTVAYLV